MGGFWFGLSRLALFFRFKFAKYVNYSMSNDRQKISKKQAWIPNYLKISFLLESSIFTSVFKGTRSLVIWDRENYRFSKKINKNKKFKAKKKIFSLYPYPDQKKKNGY